MYLYSAVIIEPRSHPALKLVLNNFITNLDNRWQIIIFHGLLNEEYLLDIINNNFTDENKQRIKLIKLNVNNLTFNEYSMILIHENIYKYIPTEMFLIFQIDTLISEKYKDLIYEFMEYDYVGAPWLHKEVGNGGLSLRRKSKMLEIIKKNKNIFKSPNIYHNEDAYFIAIDNNYNIYKPDFEKAKRFSIECVYNDISFGIHKPWLYLNNDEINKISKFIPEIYLLIENNNNKNDYNYNIYKSIEDIFNIKEI